MDDVGQAAALALAAVLALAAWSKARDLAGTAASFRGLRLPAPALLAIAVPAVEALTAAALVVRPALAAWVALALLVAFTVVIGRAMARGDDVPCACFGSGATRPVGAGDLVRNAGLASLAVLASGAGSGSALWPSSTAAVAVAAAVSVGAAALGLLRPGNRWLSGGARTGRGRP